MNRLSVALAVCLALLVVVVAPRLDLPGPVEVAPDTEVLAQGSIPTANNVEATMFTTSVSWRTVPAAFVRVELRDDSDSVVGIGNGLADEEGHVTVTFRGGRQPGGPRQPGQPGPGNL